MGIVESGELFEWIVANDIAIEDKEGRIIFA
jgi:hypothetical protein